MNIQDGGDSFIRTGEPLKTPFHYKDCGLEGIYLLNGYEIEEIDGEEYVSIQDVEELHVAIGQHIAVHSARLTPTEIRFLRRTLNWTQEKLSNEIGYSDQSVARWEKGEKEPMVIVDKFIRILFLSNTLDDDQAKDLSRRIREAIDSGSNSKPCEVVRLQHNGETGSKWFEPSLQLAVA